MGRIADDAAARTKGAPVCPVRDLLDKMDDPEDRVDTEGLLAQPRKSMPATVIKTSLDEFFKGKSPSVESIRHHRNHVCGCAHG